LDKKFTLVPGDFLVLTRPAALKPLAIQARFFLLASVFGLLVTAFAFPPVTEPLFKKAYASSKSGGGFFDSVKSMFKSEKGKPLWQVRQEQWQTAFYWIFLAIGLAGIWLFTGEAARTARDEAQKAENEGKALLQSQQLEPGLSRLIESARWTLDPAHRRTINDTIAQVRARVAAQTAGVPAAPQHTVVTTGAGQGAGAGGTQILSADQTAVMTAAADTVGPGGRYRLVRLLGKGGMGEVYEAHDTMLDRTVALKKLPAHLSSDPQFVQRFTQEAKALAKLAHPAVVQVFDILQDRQGLFIALEFVAGGDLIGVLEKQGRMSPSRATQLGRQMAEGLAYAHGQNIVHRDIKPHNILLTADGAPKLTDFGLAKIGGATQMTVDGAIMGSPAYMSPEQAEGKTADKRSDVYSFGVMLFNMLAGRPPFEGDTRQVLMQHLTQRVPPLPDVPADLDAIVQKCTERDPDLRYADGAALAAAIRMLSGE
jgi:hypothetical protein